MQLGIFPSGTLLAFGFDKQDHSARLLILKQSGEFVKWIPIPNGDVPRSMVSGDEGAHPHRLDLTQMVRLDRSIVIAQIGGAYPLMVYEVDPQDGTVLRRLATSEGQALPDSVACVHDDKFLSLEFGDDKIIPLIGRAEISSAEIPAKK